MRHLVGNWSSYNRLLSASVSGASGGTVSFDYDALGQPIVKRGSTGQVKRVTLFDGASIVADLDSVGNRQAEYVYDAGTDAPYAMVTGPTSVTAVRYFAQDDFGNVQGQFADSVNATEKVSYGEWGLPTVSGETTPNRLTWKGLSYDPDVGLTYVRARWYDPNIGRFVSEDPLGLQAGINPYVFANNDPINGADPSGMDECITIDVPPAEVCSGNQCTDYDGYTKTVCISGGGGGAGGSGSGGIVGTGGGESGSTVAQQPKPKPNSPYPYKPLKSCPAFLTKGFTARTLANAWNSSMMLPGHPETGGYIYAVGNTTTLMVDPAAPNPGAEIDLPRIIPGQTNLWYHTHPNFGGRWIQGPSGQDALTTMALHIPAAIISHDSLFFITADGHATGCAR